MKYEQEIKKREQILKKIYTGSKVPLEEKEWLALHCAFNRSLGYPYLNEDIIPLVSGEKYHIKIQIEKKEFVGRILPVVEVPLGKGEITTGYTLKDYSGKGVSKPVKILGCLLEDNRSVEEFLYQSTLGGMRISYECEFFDSQQNVIIRKNSNTCDTRYAMIKKVLLDNKVLYFCKAPMEKTFDGLVFSVYDH